MNPTHPTTPPDPPTAGGGNANGSAYATVSSVAGLAREIDALRRQLAGLLAIPARLDELAGLLAQLAGATAPAQPPAGNPVVSWLDLDADTTVTHQLLAGLVEWMGRVYLRYPDAAAGLPDCWLWHPDLVEELLWLRHAWLAAYHDDQAPVTAPGDWHDRYRPGVARRINATAGRCSPENHQPREGQPPPAAPVVPGADAAERIATWWATHRSDPPPEPDPWQLATASARNRPGPRR